MEATSRKKGDKEIVQIKIKWIKIPENNMARVFFAGNETSGTEHLGFFDLATGNPVTWTDLLVKSMASTSAGDKVSVTKEATTTPFGSVDATMPIPSTSINPANHSLCSSVS